jgi:hypothetical protein
VLDREAIYLGWHFGHYGHFLLETLARAWALTDSALPVLLHLPDDQPPQGPVLRLLEAFEVPSERILILTRPTMLRRVHFPEPLYEISLWVHDRAAKPYCAVAARVLHDADPPTHQPVYLSRRRLPSNQRQVIGEEDLEAVLRENDFKIAYPETMSLEAQIALFNRHSDVFSVDGSAIHGALFSLTQPRLHILSDRTPRIDHFLVAHAARSDAAFVCCLGDGDRGLPHVGGRYFPHLLAPERIVGYLTERGFLHRGDRAESWLRKPGQRRDYDETWLYARLRQAIRGRQPADELPATNEAEARNLALLSWPLSAALARYYVNRDPGLVHEFSARFADLAADETDPVKLARYARDISRMAAEIFRVEPTAAARLEAALARSFAPAHT